MLLLIEKADSIFMTGCHFCLSFLNVILSEHHQFRTTDHHVFKCTFWLTVSSLVLLETLRNYFSQYGEVVDCVIMKDKSTNQSRGFGFVKFKDPNCVRTVLDTKPHNLDGRNVRKMTDKSLCLVLKIASHLMLT